MHRVEISLTSHDVVLRFLQNCVLYKKKKVDALVLLLFLCWMENTHSLKIQSLSEIVKIRGCSSLATHTMKW